jgi:hypothetical protein
MKAFILEQDWGHCTQVEEYKYYNFGIYPYLALISGSSNVPEGTRAAAMSGKVLPCSQRGKYVCNAAGQ